jgi:hypothetical protein
MATRLVRGGTKPWRPGVGQHMTTSDTTRRVTRPTTFPRSGHHGPNLATLDQVRRLGSLRPSALQSRRRASVRPLAQECAAC